MPRRPRVLLGCTGSVAAVKVPELALHLGEFAELRIVKTVASEHFLAHSAIYDEPNSTAFQELDPPVEQFGDMDEWAKWKQIGEPVVHIMLREWADVLLIAPLSANTLAKLANGICDNLMTCVCRAWDFTTPKPMLVAPAMNTHMWSHPFSGQHLRTLEALGAVVIPPVVKVLACGDKGVGAMASVDTICAKVREVV
ncbi:unnamed protein product, partial [Chrysoparadoxa australica]